MALDGFVPRLSEALDDWAPYSVFLAAVEENLCWKIIAMLVVLEALCSWSGFAAAVAEEILWYKIIEMTVDAGRLQ